MSFFQKSIRGDISQCSNRSTVANNKFFPNHNPSQPTTYIVYSNATNSYRAFILDYLPQGDFRWLSNTKIDGFDCNRVSNHSNKGFAKK